MPDIVSAEYLRDQAAKCLRLAQNISDHEAIAALRNMAMDYMSRADRLEAEGGRAEPHPMPPPDVSS